MTKNVKWIFVALLVSFVFYSFVGKDTPTEGLTIGDKAPSFRICSEEQEVDLKKLKGKYVLLSFWASYDAPSRMQNAALSHAVSKNNLVEMVSVSFDSYQTVFKEAIRKDHIATKNCFVELDAENSGIYRSYRLHKGFKNYLLDKDGIIIGKDINVKELSSYLN